MKKFICAVVAFTVTVSAQSPNTPPTPQALSDAVKQGTPIPAMTTVKDSVGVTAVLLPQNAVRRLFGADIAKTYAAVEVVVSNKNPDSAFVVHTAYIDTEHWALGGGTQGQSTERLDPSPSRAGTYPHQYASVEARIVRGQLLDAQMWTGRNWTTRLLTLAGSLASASTFAFKEQGIAKGITAFSGTFVPGVSAAWPDGTVAQLNNVSDFGYQTNKVVGKDSGDIMVCFFPIDMFLSAPFRQIFLNAPGLFASPYQILYTPTNKPYRDALNIDDSKVKALIKLHQCYSKMFEAAPAPKASNSSPSLADTVQQNLTGQCKAELTDPKNKEDLDTLAYIGRFGLQNITVYVDGIMTVDVDTIPATIDGVTFAGDPTQASFWAANTKVSGSVACRLCQNGSVDITVTDSTGKPQPLKVTQGASSASALEFSFMVDTIAIPPGSKLTFTITKHPADTTKPAVTSGSYVYTVPATAPKN